MNQDVYLSDEQVAKRYSVGRATIWRWSKQGILPAPVKFSTCCTRWSLSALLASEEKRMKAAG